jgi:hypothetical protein
LKKNQVSPFSNTNTLLQVRLSLFFFFFFFGGGGVCLGPANLWAQAIWRWKKAF